MKWIVTVCILLWASQNLQAQNYRIKEYNNNNGLISADNHNTYQDSAGFYWIACFGGLVRFDGTTFKPFRNSDGLKNFDVTQLIEERRGKFWVCNERTLFIFDGKTFHEPKTNIVKPATYKKIIRLNTGELILLTDKGALKKQADNVWIPFRPGGISCADAEDIIEYQKGCLLIWSQNPSRLEFIRNDVLNKTLALPPSFKSMQIYLVDSLPFFATADGLYTIHENGLHLYVPPGFSATKSIRSIYKDQKGMCWLTDTKDDVWKQENRIWQNMTLRYRLKKMPFPKYMEDLNGNLVITTLSAVTVFKEAPYREILVPSFENINSVYFAMPYHGDTICVGIGKQGLLLVCNGKQFFEPIVSNHSVNYPGIKSCFVSRSGTPDVYIIYIPGQGLYTLKQHTLTPFYKYKADFSETYLAALYDSVRNRYFVNTRNKVLIVGEETIDTIDLTKFGGRLTPHNFCLMDDSSVFLAASHRLLFHYKNNLLTDVTSSIKVHDGDFSIHHHKQSIWVILHGKALKEYEYKNGRLEHKQTITHKSGLIDVNINRIQFDENDNLWLNCFTGIYFLKNKKEHKDRPVFTQKVAVSLSENDAPMLDNILYHRQRLFAVGYQGAIDINADFSAYDINPLATYFSDINFNLKPIENLLDEKIATLENGQINLPYNYNNLSLNINTIYFGYDEAIQYDYILKGQDEEWKSLYNTHVISYNNLNDGSYTLVVRSSNQINDDSYTEASYSFIIHPPYWKTWWFRLLAAVIAIGLIIYLIRVRDKQKEKGNTIAIQLSELKLEALQSQMNPHFIFNALNSIQNYILKNDSVEAARYLSKFSKLIRKTLDNSYRHFIPMEDIVSTLNMYLELEAFRLNNEFTYSVELDSSDDRIYTVELPPMLLQPFVENAILHGLMPKQGEKNLKVSLYIQDDEVHCVVDDNGVGRHAKTKPEGHVSSGQKLVQGMLESLKHLQMNEPKIIYTDKYDQDGQAAGCTVHIVIPISS